MAKFAEQAHEHGHTPKIDDAIQNSNGKVRIADFEELVNSESRILKSAMRLQQD